MQTNCIGRIWDKHGLSRPRRFAERFQQKQTEPGSASGHERTMRPSRSRVRFLTSNGRHSDIRCYGRSWPTADHDRSVLSSSSTPHISWWRPRNWELHAWARQNPSKLRCEFRRRKWRREVKTSELCQASIDIITIAKEPPEPIERFVSSSGRDRASYFSLRLLLRAHVR